MYDNFSLSYHKLSKGLLNFIYKKINSGRKDKNNNKLMITYHIVIQKFI